MVAIGAEDADGGARGREARRVNRGPNRESLFRAIPPLVIFLAGIVGGLELLFVLADSLIDTEDTTRFRVRALVRFGFWTEDFRQQFDAGSIFTLNSLNLLTYPLMHYTTLQAVFSATYILTVGKMLCNFVRAPLVPATFFLSAAFGAVFLSFLADYEIPLAGSAPGYFGLLGLLAGSLLAFTGRGGTVSPTLIRLPFLLMVLQIVLDFISPFPAFWPATLGGFASGLVISVISTKDGLRLMLAGARKLLKQ